MEKRPLSVTIFYVLVYGVLIGVGALFIWGSSAALSPFLPAWMTERPNSQSAGIAFFVGLCTLIVVFQIDRAFKAIMARLDEIERRLPR